MPHKKILTIFLAIFLSGCSAQSSNQARSPDAKNYIMGIGVMENSEGYAVLEEPKAYMDEKGHHYVVTNAYNDGERTVVFLEVYSNILLEQASDEELLEWLDIKKYSITHNDIRLLPSKSFDIEKTVDRIKSYNKISGISLFETQDEVAFYDTDYASVSGYCLVYESTGKMDKVNLSIGEAELELPLTTRAFAKTVNNFLLDDIDISISKLPGNRIALSAENSAFSEENSLYLDKLSILGSAFLIDNLGNCYTAKRTPLMRFGEEIFGTNEKIMGDIIGFYFDDILATYSINKSETGALLDAFVGSENNGLTIPIELPKADDKSTLNRDVNIGETMVKLLYVEQENLLHQGEYYGYAVYLESDNDIIVEPRIESEQLITKNSPVTVTYFPTELVEDLQNGRGIYKAYTGLKSNSEFFSNAQEGAVIIPGYKKRFLKRHILWLSEF